MSDLRLPALNAANEAHSSNPAADGAANAATAFDAVMARYMSAPGQPARDPQRAAPPRATSIDDEDETTAVADALAAVDAAALIAAAVPAEPNGAAEAPAPVTAEATAADASSNAAAQAPVQPAPIAATAPGKARSADIVAARAERAPVPDSATAPQSTAAASARAAAGEDKAAAQAAGALHAEATANATSAPHALPIATNGAPAAARFAVAHAAVSAPVTTAAFAPEFAQRVVLFARGKLQHAEISVTPPELGPISVSIEVRGQEATLAFAAPSHATRAAIEEALPRLRELLAAHGLQLTGAAVNDQPRREDARGAPSARAHERAPAAQRAAIEVAAAAPRRHVGLIDIVV